MVASRAGRHGGERFAARLERVEAASPVLAAVSRDTEVEAA
jgi:hypothetical protein